MFQVTVNNVGDVFSRFFVYCNAYFAFFLSLGSAKADIGRGEKLIGYLMASCVRNIHAKILRI